MPEIPWRSSTSSDSALLARVARAPSRALAAASGGQAEVVEAIAPGEVLLVETRSLPVSAREIRGLLAAGRSVRYLVPPTVADYIAQHHLYAEPQ